MPHTTTFPAWPARQQVVDCGGPTIKRTQFSDTAAYHPQLIESLLEMERQGLRRSKFFHGGCGIKIYGTDELDIPGARLINERAMELFRRATGSASAVTDSCWANIYYKNDYCMPHSHTRSTAAVVYMLDPGDPDPADPLDGKFCIVDPRVSSCCQIEQEVMSNPFMPDMQPGSMLIFPGQIVHCVNPYTGTRPRITLSWNINERTIPGSPDEAFRGSKGTIGDRPE